MYKKILLASDGSEHSLRATDHALKLARCNPDAMLEIVYVINSANAKSHTLENWNTLGVLDTDEEKISKTKSKVEKSEVKYNLKTLHGEPGPTIVEYANNNDIEIVVVGSRGLNGLQEMVLGSTSHKIAKRIQCPVLIIK